MSEWKEVRFDEIGDVFSGGTPSTTNSELWNGNIAFVTPYDLSKSRTPFIKQTQRYITQKGLEQSSANLLPANNLILSSRAPIGYISLSATEFVTNQGCKSLKFFENQEPLFHYYNLQMYVDEMKRYGVGTTFSEISKGDLSKLKIRIPKEKNEQKRIAHILTTCDSVIEQTQSAIAKYKAIKQGLLHDLFTRGLDANGHLRPSYNDAPELYKESELEMIPKEWEVRSSAEVVKFINGRAYSIHEWETHGTPVIRLQNLTGSGDTFYYSNLKLPDNQYCEKGDLLYMWSASFGPHIWKGDKAIFHYHIWKVECSKKMLQSYFYYDLLRFTETVLNGANGSTMAHITKENMDKRLIKTPSIHEQTEIAERINSLENELQTEETLLQKYQSIKRGLMGDLLGGKITVGDNGDAAT